MQGQCGAYFESMAVVVNISGGELFEELAVSGCGETCVQSVGHLGQPQLTQDILERTRVPAWKPVRAIEPPLKWEQHLARRTSTRL